MLIVKIVQGPSSVGDVFNLENGGTYVIGRSDGAEIQLKSSGISKNHCRITVLPGNRLDVEDLKSSNGTFINGLQIKKSIMKVGDSLTLNSYTIKLLQKAPEKVRIVAAPASSSYTPPSFDGNAAFQLDGMAAGVPSAQTELFSTQNTGAKVGGFLSSNVYPLADYFSSNFDVRFLVASFFLIWSVLLIMFTAWPFSSAANVRVENQAIEVARLYARQLTRVNTEAIVAEDYRSLVATLDKHPGQTRGIVASYIIDVSRNQVMAPQNELGRAFTNEFSQAAIETLTGTQNPNLDYVGKDDTGMAYVASPLMVSTAEGNKTVAIAFVQINTNPAKFSTAELFDQIISSLLYSLIISLLLIIFVYRWMNGPFELLSEQIEQALRKGQTQLSVAVQLPAVKELSEKISFALSKAQPAPSSESSSSSGSSEWASAMVNANTYPAFSIDGSGSVQSWNERIERLMGISSSEAVGREFSQISRDMELEQIVRSLMSEVVGTPWSTSNRSYVFNENEITINVTSGAGIYLVVISPGGAA